MDDNRRPIRARSTRWANAITQWLIRTGISPNHISLISILFAALGAGALVLAPGITGSVLCLLGIQGRLLCNLFDGMVATRRPCCCSTSLVTRGRTRCCCST
ncbi:hypothetical protein [Pseudomonas sp. NPDC007930]|uniref:hypothetical protein n=1 Tax=Pseudomonas sp. NPDC007930 TaxID=3364417 RepID=UPI0036E18944